jgi:hypothetical protein
VCRARFREAARSARLEQGSGSEAQRAEHKLENHDEAIAAILSAIRELLRPPVPKRRPIGFTADLEEKSEAGAGNERISGGRPIRIRFAFLRGKSAND